MPYYNYALWENEEFVVVTPKNPHIPYSEGPHVVIAPKEKISSAWTDMAISTHAFRIATQVCSVMDKLGIAPWFNIQSNGNFGLLEESGTSFHVHIYGRKKTGEWGKPVSLPETADSYYNESMPQKDREKLIKELSTQLN